MPVVRDPKVVVVTLNWNGKEDTLRCLGSLRAMDYGNLQIIVVDNGSQDGSVEALAQDGGLVLIANRANLGFTGGMNQGIERGKALGAEYFLLLNNDTVASKYMLRKLVEAHLQNRDSGILAPAVYNLAEQNRIQSMGGRIDWASGSSRLIGMGEEDRGQFKGTYDTDYAHGCCLLVPGNVMAEVGGYDDDYFAYWDEVDLAVKVREKGHRVLIVTGAKIYHKGYATAERSGSAFPVYYMTRNRILFMRKHARTAHLLVFSYVLSKNIFGSFLLYASRKNGASLRALLKGFRDGLVFPLSRN